MQSQISRQTLTCLIAEAGCTEGVSNYEVEFPLQMVSCSYAQPPLPDPPSCTVPDCLALPP